MTIANGATILASDILAIQNAANSALAGLVNGGTIVNGGTVVLTTAAPGTITLAGTITGGATGATGASVNAGTITSGGSLDLILTNGTTVAVVGSVVGPPGPAGGASSLTLTGLTANGSSGTLPASAVVTQLLFTETAGNAVSVMLGTTSGSSDIMAAVTVPAGGILPVGNMSLLQQVFASSQAVFVSSSVWNSASVNLKVWYVQ